MCVPVPPSLLTNSSCCATPQRQTATSAFMTHQQQKPTQCGVGMGGLCFGSSRRVVSTSATAAVNPINHTHTPPHPPTSNCSSSGASSAVSSSSSSCSSCGMSSVGGSSSTSCDHPPLEVLVNWLTSAGFAEYERFLYYRSGTDH